MTSKFCKPSSHHTMTTLISAWTMQVARNKTMSGSATQIPIGHATNVNHIHASNEPTNQYHRDLHKQIGRK